MAPYRPLTHRLPARRLGLYTARADAEQRSIHVRRPHDILYSEDAWPADRAVPSLFGRLASWLVPGSLSAARYPASSAGPPGNDPIPRGLEELQARLAAQVGALIPAWVKKVVF